jgi:pimeloyl-ACP methyl ester carboxylesterase
LLCAQVVNNRQDVELKCSQWKPVGAHLDELPCVLYLHGNASCRLEALQVLKVVLELGCTLCCVDMAGSGLSEGEFVSLGHFEKFDAEAVLHELRSGGRSNGRVALWGRSMGAATALMCAARLDPLVSCVVADSAFASLPMLVHDLLDEKVGSVLVDAAMGVVSRSVAYRAGFKITDVRVDAVAPVCPILLVHGSDDTFVGLKHSEKLQQAFKHTATLRVDDGGKHDSRRARPVWKSNSGAPRDVFSVSASARWRGG